MVTVNYNSSDMYKIGRCSQDPHDYVKRLKCYPKGSKICFVFVVPDARVVDGKEYFHGDEKAMLAILSAKMHTMYTTADTRHIIYSQYHVQHLLQLPPDVYIRIFYPEHYEVNKVGGNMCEMLEVRYHVQK